MGKDSSLNGLQVNHPGTEADKKKDETKAITESIPIPKTKNATTKENTSTCFTIDLLVTFLDTLVCFYLLCNKQTILLDNNAAP